MFPCKDKSYYKLFLEKKIDILDNFNTGIEKKRYSYPQLLNYINRKKNEKVCSLVGLRRTGKTTEMLQCADELSRQGKKVLFLSIAEPTENDLMKHPDNLVQLSELYDIIDDAQNNGYQAIFIDEITYVNDFLYANLLANKYAIKTPIIISGTDSLVFEIAGKNALYDRMIKIPTSYISFEEFNYLLPDKTLEDYIKFGGTLHDESPYKKAQDAKEYINTAIAGNIIHALRFEAVDKDFESLTELYKSDELKGAIQKLTNKAGQNVAIRAIRKEYESAPIRTTFRNISQSKKPVEPDFDLAAAKKSEVLNCIERELREVFEIKLNSELCKEFKDSDYAELKCYLYDIGLLREVPVYLELSEENIVEDKPKEIILQPGMLYCHAQEALKSLTLHEKAFEDWHIENRSQFMDRLDHQTKGDILETIILFDTYSSFPRMENVNDNHHYYVSKLSLKNIIYHDTNLDGEEIDLIVRTPESNKIYLFEVKYSTEKVPEEQAKHLKNNVLLDYIEHNFNGKICGRAVIYNGSTDMRDEIKYINASDYLKNIRKIQRIEELFLSFSEKKTDSEKSENDSIPDVSIPASNDSGKGTGESNKIDSDIKNCSDIKNLIEENEEPVQDEEVDEIEGRE